MVFSVSAKVIHPKDRSLHTEMSFIANPRSTLSWIPKGVGISMGLPPLGPRQFSNTNGETLTRETAFALVSLQNRLVPTVVVLAEPAEAATLGLVTLESLGFGVDELNRRLVPKDLLAMRGAIRAKGLPR